MDRQYDVIVVGAGILGVASAYHLKKNNPSKEVLVLDRYGAPGQGNTGRSNAMFRNTFSSKDNQVMSDSTIDFYLHVQEQVGVDLGLQRIGYLWLMDENQLSHSEPYLNEMERGGIEVRRYGSDDLKKAIPALRTEFGADAEAEVLRLPKVDGGVFGPKCGRLDPDKLVRFYASEFVKLGGVISFNSNVEGLLVNPSERLGIDGEPFVWQDSMVEGVRVGGDEAKELHAEKVVLAGGAWGNELLEPIGLDGHVKAKKRQIFSIEAAGSARLGRLLRTQGFSSLGLLPMTILPKAGVHFKPVVEEGVFWAACEDEINRPFIDIPGHDLDAYRAEPEYYEKSLLPILSAYFPDFRNARIKSMWGGLYSYNTLDFVPFVFSERNLVVVGGDSGSGIMKGDSLGRIVDAVYRGVDEAELYGGGHYHASKLSFDHRDVEREEWVI